MMPGGAEQCFQIFGPEAKAAVPELAAILSRPAKSNGELGAQMSAVTALSYLGPDAVPVLLHAATNFHGTQLQSQIIRDIANFGFQCSSRQASPLALEPRH